jgi:hypothetical protein
MPTKGSSVADKTQRDRNGTPPETQQVGNRHVSAG